MPATNGSRSEDPATTVHFGRRRLLDIAATADYLGTTPRHVRRLVEQRRISFLKLGDGRSARLRFDTKKLDAWLDEHTFEPEDKV
jgi:excisionase family DNA binding protein